MNYSTDIKPYLHDKIQQEYSRMVGANMPPQNLLEVNNAYERASALLMVLEHLEAINNKEQNERWFGGKNK